MSGRRFIAGVGWVDTSWTKPKKRKPKRTTPRRKSAPRKSAAPRKAPTPLQYERRLAKAAQQIRRAYEGKGSLESMDRKAAAVLASYRWRPADRRDLAWHIAHERKTRPALASQWRKEGLL